jgi:hypothetical protein
VEITYDPSADNLPPDERREFNSRLDHAKTLNDHIDDDSHDGWILTVIIDKRPYEYLLTVVLPTRHMQTTGSVLTQLDAYSDITIHGLSVEYTGLDDDPELVVRIELKNPDQE